MAASNNLIRNEIREAVRDEISRILGSPSTSQVSRGNEPAIRSTRQFCQFVETKTQRSHSARKGNASSSGSNTLSYEDFYKMRERDHQQGSKPPSKKKKKSSSTADEPKKVVNVDIKVGVATQSDGKIEMQRGKTH